MHLSPFPPFASGVVPTWVMLFFTYSKPLSAIICHIRQLYWRTKKGLSVCLALTGSRGVSRGETRAEAPSCQRSQAGPRGFTRRKPEQKPRPVLDSSSAARGGSRGGNPSTMPAAALEVRLICLAVADCFPVCFVFFFHNVRRIYDCHNGRTDNLD